MYGPVAGRRSRQGEPVQDVEDRIQDPAVVHALFAEVIWRKQRATPATQRQSGQSASLKLFVQELESSIPTRIVRQNQPLRPEPVLAAVTYHRTPLGPEAVLPILQETSHL